MFCGSRPGVPVVGSCLDIRRGLVVEAKPLRPSNVIMRSIVRAEIESKWSLRRREEWVWFGLRGQIKGFEGSRLLV